MIKIKRSDFDILNSIDKEDLFYEYYGDHSRILINDLDLLDVKDIFSKLNKIEIIANILYNDNKEKWEKHSIIITGDSIADLITSVERLTKFGMPQITTVNPNRYYKVFFEHLDEYLHERHAMCSYDPYRKQINVYDLILDLYSNLIILNKLEYYEKLDSYQFVYKGSEEWYERLGDEYDNE